MATESVAPCPQCGETPDSPTYYRHQRCGEGPPYDEELQADLESRGLDTIKTMGYLNVTGTANEARFNSAMWFAMKHGLAVEHALILRRPE